MAHLPSDFSNSLPAQFDTVLVEETDSLGFQLESTTIEFGTAWVEFERLPLVQRGYPVLRAQFLTFPLRGAVHSLLVA